MDKHMQRELAYMNMLLTAYGIPEEQEPLSITSRGIVKNVSHAKAVVRISHFVSDTVGSGPFSSYFYNHQDEVHGLVPILGTPLFLDGDYVVEKYEEIMHAQNTHLDLQSFCARGGGVVQSCRYLCDVIQTVADLHDHKWAHMDLSLENVVLSPNKAFLIDFESCTSFQNGDGFVAQKDVVGPLKTPLCPPEHLLGNDDDLVSLKGYDVWAFGVMLFAVLFDTFLFTSWMDPRSNCVRIEKGQVRYLCREGFQSFLRKYHPGIYEELNQNCCNQNYDEGSESRYHLDYESSVLAYDLLAHLFVKNKRKRSVRTKRILHSTELRLSARQVAKHPFWKSISSK